MKHRLVLFATAIVAVGSLSLAACSSSDSTSTSTTSTTASSGAQVTDTECPFTGTVGTSSGGTASVASNLTSISTSKEGCADDIQLKMSAGVGPWSAQYVTGQAKDATGAAIASQGAATLVVTFKNGSWSGTPAIPTTVLPVQLDYVKSINVASGPDGSVLVVFGLSAQKPYVATDSGQSPGYLTLGIG